MFTKNDEERRWVNGTMGIVGRSMKAPSWSTWAAGRAASYDVEPVSWESYEYVLDDDDRPHRGRQDR